MVTYHPPRIRHNKTFNYEDFVPKRYLVETEFKPGQRAVIYSGDNYETAIEKTNFWDERQNTYFTDTHAGLAHDALSVAMRKFDALEQYIKDMGWNY